MRLFADLTGGNASFNTNDVGGSIERAVDDSRVIYTIGYYPDQAKWDGTFHEIKVKVNRPGVQVRCRRGYYASRQTVTPDQKQRVQLMLAAASDPLESTEVGMSLETISVNATATPHVKMRLTIDPRNVLLDPNAGRWTGAVDLYYVETDARQHVLTSLARTLALNLGSADYDKTLKEGVKLVCDFPIKPGATLIHLVALDSNSGRIGTVTIPLSTLLGKSNAN